MSKKENQHIVYVELEDYFPKEIRQKYKLGEYAEDPMLIKIKSVIFGHAVGDALGVPVEGCSRKVLDEYPVVEMTGYGAYPVPAGSWSDDTSMSLAALDSLAEGKVVYHDIMGNFQMWRYNGKYTLAGGLAGALYGYDAIPEEWLKTLQRRDYIEEMCKKASCAWISKTAKNS